MVDVYLNTLLGLYKDVVQLMDFVASFANSSISYSLCSLTLNFNLQLYILNYIFIAFI